MTVKSGSGVSADDFAKMKARLEAAEAENERLKSRGGIRFDFSTKGSPIGKTGRTRDADVVTVSGGPIGYPITHTIPKWYAVLDASEAVRSYLDGLKK